SHAWDTQPYHIQILDNVCYNGFGDTAHTDGECVIIDVFDGCTYNGHAIIAGNVAYNNGGACLELNRANNFDIFNNSCYGNWTLLLRQQYYAVEQFGSVLGQSFSSDVDLGRGVCSASDATVGQLAARRRRKSRRLML